MGRLLRQRSRRKTPAMHPAGELLELWTLPPKEVEAVVEVMVEEAVDEEEVKNFMFLIKWKGSFVFE